MVSNKRTIAALAVTALAVGGITLAVQAADAGPSGDCSTASRDLVVVAHHGDDLLYLNPEIDSAIAAGNCVQAIYLGTAEGAGGSLGEVAKKREEGTRAAYALMAGADHGDWKRSRANFAAADLVSWSLGSQLQLIDLRLPTSGDAPGLSQLVTEGATVSAVGAGAYNEETLTEVLTAAIDAFEPTRVLTTDPSASEHHGEEGVDFDGDHVAAARLVSNAAAAANNHPPVAYFRGLDSAHADANLNADQAARNLDVYQAFAARDPQDCETSTAVENCSENGLYYAYTQRNLPATPVAQLPWVAATSQRAGQLTQPQIEGTPLKHVESDLCLTADLKFGACDDSFTLVEGFLKTDRTNQCVTAAGGEDGADVTVAPCTGASLQKWTIDNSRFVAGDTGLVLSPQSPKPLAGGVAVLGKPRNDPSQRFAISDLKALPSLFNNVGLTSYKTAGSGNYGANYSFNQDNFEKQGILPGQKFVSSVDGVTYQWPHTAGTSEPDNVAANGQVIRVKGKGKVLGLLGSGNGRAGGTVIVAYTDGTTTTAVVEFADWFDTAGDEDFVAISTLGRNGENGGIDADKRFNVYSHAIRLDQSKNVESITLPVDTDMHIFAVGFGDGERRELSKPDNKDLEQDGKDDAKDQEDDSDDADRADRDEEKDDDADERREPRPGVTTPTQDKDTPRRGDDTKDDAAKVSIFMPYNNVGATTKKLHKQGDFDNLGNSFNQDDLALQGLTPGKRFTAKDVSYIWPATAGTGKPDNVIAAGQTIKVQGGPTARKIGFLGAGAPSQSGKVIVTYTDGSTTKKTVRFAGWVDDLRDRGDIVASVKGRNMPLGFGQEFREFHLYSKTISVNKNKRIASITLPKRSGMHFFAIGFGN